jgi:hypothetical protein
MRTRSWSLLTGCLALSTGACFVPAYPPLWAQVFVVGEKTATADISTDFKRTNVTLPSEHLSERGRRDLVRNLEAEQGFAHLALPVGELTLQANGNLSPSPEEYRKRIYSKGQSAAPGDRVIITALAFKGNSIVIDFNGGPYAKHRFLSHIQLNDAPVVAQQNAATGSRVTLVFEGFVPEVSAPEVKALLEPVIDFGVKSSEQAYANTLPPKLRDAIAAHEVLVGMNHRMVLAAMGAPESKVREQQSGDPNGQRYEEWIYGHVPQTVTFVRFVGDRVKVVEIAALGKPLEIHDKDEMDGARDPADTRVIAMGDRTGEGEEGKSPPPPSLRLPGESAPPSGQGQVQYPTDKSDKTPIPPPPGSQTPPASTSPPTTPTSTNPSGRIPTTRSPNPSTYPYPQTNPPNSTPFPNQP